jgi:hypothetical protein
MIRQSIANDDHTHGFQAAGFGNDHLEKTFTRGALTSIGNGIAAPAAARGGNVAATTTGRTLNPSSIFIFWLTLVKKPEMPPRLPRRCHRDSKHNDHPATAD